jgi:hypothetical protein
MPVNTTHPEYDANLPVWLRARDVLSGEDAVKAAGEKYLLRLQDQTEEDYQAYKMRASFFNATARTADGYLGLVFRRPPFTKVPEGCSALGQALESFVNDADMLGTSLANYAKNVTMEVVAVGRVGTLIDWEGPSRTGNDENRAYATLYAAENILNWRMERINGRCVLAMVALHETVRVANEDGKEIDEYEHKNCEQIRVLKLVPVTGGHDYACQVEIWQKQEKAIARVQGQRDKAKWKSFASDSIRVSWSTELPSHRGQASPG